MHCSNKDVGWKWMQKIWYGTKHKSMSLFRDIWIQEDIIDNAVINQAHNDYSLPPVLRFLQYLHCPKRTWYLASAKHKSFWSHHQCITTFRWWCTWWPCIPHVCKKILLHILCVVQFQSRNPHWRKRKARPDFLIHTLEILKLRR